ncbi:MAG: Rieske 2Fe-2S domain-containing protein [Myxococcota bacterium]|nr:Rieske 2Fe-2S domain-containing protein [Myxococcota bacterium]
MAERLPLPIPFGWFRVADSASLATGEVRAERYAGRELVLFRDASGTARVFHAYCPHLGAHLGHGGTVDGETLRCPFHGWRFDGSGRCVAIDYARRIPARARVESYPVCEKNGMVFFWYHPKGESPGWEIPDVPELRSDAWMPPHTVQYRVRSHAQEMAENVVDPAHFQVVHGTPYVPEMDVTIDGHIFRGYQGLTFTTPAGEKEGRVDVENHGGSFGVTRFQGIVDTLLVIAGAPVDAELHETTIHFSVRLVPGQEDASRGIGRAFIDEVTRQYTQDIPIWENKRFVENPVLCDGDGPIGTIRRYYAQFYV